MNCSMGERVEKEKLKPEDGRLAMSECGMPARRTVRREGKLSYDKTKLQRVIESTKLK